MRKSKSVTDSNDRLYRALAEPITEVDSMRPKDVALYLEANGFDRKKMWSALATRISEVQIKANARTNEDLAKRFNTFGASLAAAVGESRRQVSLRFKGVLLASPQRAAKIVADLESADESAMKELYEELKRLGEGG